jgi:IS605 OrfB family transposase
VTADGETGKNGGNETIRLDGQGRLRLKVPAALAGKHGTHLQVAAPVRFSHGGTEVTARIAGNQAVRYDISFDAAKGRWYLDASWAITAQEPAELDQLRQGRVLGVDLNADHLAACVLDASGNPVAEPVTIGLAVHRLRASRRDGRLRAAITALLDTAQQRRCSAVVVENLNFADARTTGRETMGRGQRGKTFRRTVAGIPTAKFRDRLTAMATRRGIAVIGVDPAYTSKWGDQHWRKPLQQKTSDPVTRHHGAAAAIGRRGLGKPIRRRPAGPRTQQRMGAGTPPARPVKTPRTQGGAHRSGSPPRPTGVPVRRTACTTRGQDRSGRNRAELTTAQ